MPRRPAIEGCRKAVASPPLALGLALAADCFPIVEPVVFPGVEPVVFPVVEPVVATRLEGTTSRIVRGRRNVSGEHARTERRELATAASGTGGQPAEGMRRDSANTSTPGGGTGGQRIRDRQGRNSS